MLLFKPGSTSDRDLRAQFSWLACSGIGRHFGTMPIGWYQAHQMCALGEIENRAVQKLRLLAWSPKDNPGRKYASEPFEVRAEERGPAVARRVLARRKGGRKWTMIGTVPELFRAADDCTRR